MRVRRELKRIFRSKVDRQIGDQEFYFTGTHINSSSLIKQFIISNLVRPDKQLEDDEEEPEYPFIWKESLINVYLQDTLPRKAKEF